MLVVLTWVTDMWWLGESSARGQLLFILSPGLWRTWLTYKKIDTDMHVLLFWTVMESRSVHYLEKKISDYYFCSRIIWWQVDMGHTIFLPRRSTCSRLGHMSPLCPLVAPVCQQQMSEILCLFLVCLENYERFSRDRSRSILYKLGSKISIRLSVII